MDATIHQLVQRAHNASGQTVLVLAGAGTEALAWLLGVAGASRTLLEAIVPYSEAAFIDFLGRSPEKYVAPETAGFLAGRAFCRAQALSKGQKEAIGLASTATITTDRPKKGAHRAHITTWGLDQVSHYTLYLAKGKRNRLEEGVVVSRLILNALAYAFRLNDRLDLWLGPEDQLSRTDNDLATAARQLTHGDTDYFAILADGNLAGKEPPPVLLSGAFNPLHAGHRELARVAAEITGKEVVFEVSAVNVDKPPLEPHLLLRRMAQFAGDWTVYASRMPTYPEKARLFPATTFVVGYDTAMRILEPRYYNDKSGNVTSALAEIDRFGCRFLVAGRKDKRGCFHEAGSLKVPKLFSHLFQPIPSDRFRHDISSTELRNKQQLTVNS